MAFLFVCLFFFPKEIAFSSILRNELKRFASGAHSEQDFPKILVKYHTSCRKGFVNQKSLKTPMRKTTESIEVNCRDQVAIWQCYKTHVYLVGKENTDREQEHRRNGVASKHLKGNANMSSITAEISGICAKDLTSSKSRYHSSIL